MTRTLLIALVLLGLCGAGGARAADAGERSTRFGVSTFPYGPSPEAAEQSFRTAAELGDLYVIQLDNGVPWKEALDDADCPAALRGKWADLRGHAPAGRPVYLALEPLGHDRVTLAPAAEGSSVPRALRSAAFDDESMKKAYLAYVRRAVRFFRPAYLNLGIENGEIAHRRPGNWRAYTALFKHVTAAVHAEFPEVQVGISFGLQSLTMPAVAERARELIDASDYVGLSFYPYMTSFHEKFGETPLSAPPDEWRKPLEWLRSYTKKPIAICETGYNTRDVDLPRWKVRMKGSAELQAQYVRELGEIARRDGYLFVVYYLPIDIGPILDSLPEDKRADADMWRENGLLNAKLLPKPALAPWRSILAARYVAPPVPDRTATAPPAGTPPGQPGPSRTLGFARESDLCQAPSPAKVQLADEKGTKAMLWDYEPRPGNWAWCSHSVAPGTMSGGEGMAFRVRSDAEGPVILQVKEAGGSGFYAIVEPTQDWRLVALKWQDFMAEGGGAKRPDAKEITKVVWADEGKGAKERRRRVWVADWGIQ